MTAQLREQGFRALRAGDWQDGLRVSSAALAVGPSDASCWHLRAVLSHSAGQAARALVEATRATRSKPDYPEAWNTIGNLFRAAGDPASARRAYQASIALAPDYPDPYNNLGSLGDGDDGGAFRLFTRALRLAPGFVDALFNAALHAPQAHRGSEHLYKAVLQLDPARADAWNNLGNGYRGAQSPAQASACFQRAHRLQPGEDGILTNLALALMHAGEIAGSRRAWRALLQRDPGSAPSLAMAGAVEAREPAGVPWLIRSVVVDPHLVEGWAELAAALLHQASYSAALFAARAAAALDPADPVIWYRVARAAGRIPSLRELRIAALRRRIVLQPSPGAYVDLGNAYESVGRLDLAPAEYEHAIRLGPQDFGAWDYLASVLRAQWRLDEAEEIARTTLVLAPDCCEALVQYGVLKQYAFNPAADVWYDRAYRLAGGEYPLLDWNRSLGLLARGNLEEGWRLYEAGIPLGKRGTSKGPFLPADWQDADVSGRTVLILHEQGVGDEIVFASCYPDMIARAGRTLIECDDRLLALFRRSFPDAHIVGDLARLEARPAYDLGVQAGTLPRYFRKAIDDFPDRKAYLVPDADRVLYWRRRFEALGARAVVGICWRGRLKTLSRMPLYAQLRQWGPILSQPGVVFVNLQYGEPEEEIREAEALFGCRIVSFPDIDLMNDFDDVAAFGRALDLAITADTAAGALVASVGTPVWRYVIRGDFMSLGTDRFPWMPSMTVYCREVREDWSVVTARIGADLGPAVDGLRLAWRPPEPASSTAEIYQPQLAFVLKSAMDHQRRGRLEAADALYRKILAYSPEEPVSWQLLGTMALGRRAYDKAAQWLGWAIRLRPDYVPALVQLGSTRRRQGRLPEAVAAYRRALVWEPDKPEALANLGECAAELADRGLARLWFRRAAQLRPYIAELEVNLGNLATAERNFDRAADHHRRAIALRPDYLEAYLNLGAALAEGRGVDEAERAYRLALTLQPGDAVALANCADLLRMRGELRASEALFQQCLEARGANSANAQFILSLIALESGDLVRGWPAYQAALASGARAHPRDLPMPRWNGAPLSGRHVLVWREQGTGDELVFASVYPDLIRQAGKATILCEPRFRSLFARSFPQALVRADTPSAVRELEGIDLHAPAGDLPVFLRARIEDFQGKPAAFLVPDPVGVEKWRQRLAGLGPGLRIGVCWRSILRSPVRNPHYAAVLDLLPVLRLPGTVLVNLQHRPDEEERAALAEAGIHLHEWPDLDLKDDFEEVSALLSGLDAVVSPETTMGALAGALGRPTFLFLHASWLALGPTDDYPWLPSVRLYRREDRNAWTGAIVGIAADLAALASGPAPDARFLDKALEAHRAGHWVEAERAYRGLLAADPANADALQLLGALALQRGDHAAAGRALRQALALDPASPQALGNLGRVLRAEDAPAAAQRSYLRALHIHPSAVEPSINLGSLLLAQGDPAAACYHFMRALTLAPGHGPLWGNLSEGLAGIGQRPLAMAALRRCLQLDPTHALAYVTLGKAAFADDDLATALALSGEALQLAPDLWHAHNLLAMCAQRLGHVGLAATAYDRALRLSGGDATVRWNRALLDLARGELAAGWDGYEAGLQTGARGIAELAGPQWPGPAAPGRVLVRREQGVGDELLFATCYGDLAQGGVDATVECDPRLLSLFRRAFPGLIFTAAPAAGAGEWQIPAGSLPRLFRRSPGDFRSTGQFLVLDAALAERWRSRVADLPGLRIGICWRSSVALPGRSLHYAALDDLAPLFDLPNVEFVCLQHDITDEERRRAADLASGRLIEWPDLDLKDDFEQTAALLAALDLVITPGVAMGCLAGAVGARWWQFTLQEDWTPLGGERLPWFPEARIFVKGAGAPWQPVFEAMAREIRPVSEAESDGAAERCWAAALAALASRDLVQAGVLLRRLLDLAPEHMEGQAELACLSRLSGDLGQALALLEDAILRQPADPHVLTHLGLVFKDMEVFDGAETCHRRALAVDPSVPAAWINLGTSLELQGRLAAAAECCKAALTLAPDNPVAWVNLGGIASALGSFEAAALCYARVDRLEPGSAVARWNVGLLTLRLGHLAAGWSGFDARFDANPQMPVRHRHLPRWDGSRLAEQRLLVWSEQGVGDEIVFASCLPELVAAAAEVTVECDPRLVSLWRRSFPGAHIRALGSRAGGEHFTAQAPSGDVARRLRTELASFASTPDAYLVPDPARAAHWRQRLEALGPGLKVGFCWRGLRRAANRRAAYTTLEQWGPVLTSAGHHFISLQYGDAEEELQAMETGCGISIRRWSDLDLKDDFEGVAALMANLDLVIGPDTTATALAGALGRPTWKLTLQNDWMRLGTDHYPWLPRVQVVPKPASGWSEAIEMIADTLRGIG